MKDVKLGAQAERALTVDESNTAAAAGSGSLAVLGTPFMIALMEAATCAAVSPFLEEGETTVGTRIEVDHLKASGTGEKITAKARITGADGRKLTFAVTAENEAGDTVGSGTVERFAVLSERFMAKLS